jgi:hypothetical protein
VGTPRDCLQFSHDYVCTYRSICAFRVVGRVAIQSWGGALAQQELSAAANTSELGGGVNIIHCSLSLCLHTRFFLRKTIRGGTALVF